MSDAPSLEFRWGPTLDRESVPDRFREVQQALRGRTAPQVRLDLGGVERMDSSGAALCHLLRQQVLRQKGTLRLAGESEAAREALSLFRVSSQQPVPPAAPPGFFQAVGDAIVRAGSALVDLLVLLTDTLHFTGKGLVSRRERIRGEAVLEQMVRIGLESTGIVALVSLLVGLTVALQSAYQLRQFGANIYLADLIGISITREMGPLITAILIAGRSGSSIAAEISTMVITEEVDALRVMGLNPSRFLLVPRFLGISLTQPLLTVVADVLGIFGGFVIATTYLDISARAFVDELISALMVKDLMTGLVKSVAFAWIIVFVGAQRGFRVTGGAEGVGKATTSSVVISLFGVIAADAFFSLLFYFGD
ncbi:MAG TPA: MlaE family lipid ABC transporter permease subunit [Myxococcota bacterium]|nr:MlaE family lipid ABC transporter permease subunit [Myxococcota bacterium]HQK51897.1 MlaE family lipid ABC transporter permease subunit [Myxococcota bacterium]